MIPKIIHYCWLSGEPYPVHILKCIESWKKILPDYEIMLWDTKMFDINKINWTRQAFERKKYAFAADYIRFYALYNYGGIYLDSDVEVLKSFNNLLHNKFFFGYEYTGVPEAAVVGSEKGCVWIKICKEWYENKNYFDYENSSKTIIAPIILQHGYEKYSNNELIDNGTISRYEGGSIYPYFYFSPKNGFTGEVIKNEETYAIHNFNSAWMNTRSTLLKLKRKVHMILIKVVGKNKYNYIIYKVRKKLHQT